MDSKIIRMMTIAFAASSMVAARVPGNHESLYKREAETSVASSTTSTTSTTASSTSTFTTSSSSTSFVTSTTTTTTSAADATSTTEAAFDYDTDVIQESADGEHILAPDGNYYTVATDGYPGVSSYGNPQGLLAAPIVPGSAYGPPPPFADGPPPVLPRPGYGSPIPPPMAYFDTYPGDEENTNHDDHYDYAESKEPTETTEADLDTYNGTGDHEDATETPDQTAYDTSDYSSQSSEPSYTPGLDTYDDDTLDIPTSGSSVIQLSAFLSIAFGLFLI